VLQTLGAVPWTVQFQPRWTTSAGAGSWKSIQTTRRRLGCGCSGRQNGFCDVLVVTVEHCTLREVFVIYYAATCGKAENKKHKINWSSSSSSGGTNRRSAEGLRSGTARYIPPYSLGPGPCRRKIKFERCNQCILRILKDDMVNFPGEDSYPVAPTGDRNYPRCSCLRAPMDTWSHISKTWGILAVFPIPVVYLALISTPFSPANHHIVSLRGSTETALIARIQKTKTGTSTLLWAEDWVW